MRQTLRWTGWLLSLALVAGLSGCVVYPVGHRASHAPPAVWQAESMAAAAPQRLASDEAAAYAGYAGGYAGYADSGAWRTADSARAMPTAVHGGLPPPSTPDAVWVGAGQAARAVMGAAGVPSSTQGQVVDIRPIAYRANPQAGAAMGTAVGGVLGGVLANQNSHRHFRGSNTMAGVLVGALLGSALGAAGSHATQTVAYRVIARMDSGVVRHIDYAQPPSVRIGERVAYDGQQFYR